MRGGIIAASMVLAGCFGNADAYRCREDAQCDAAAGGICELSDYCSYPDESCPSQRRYDDLAGGLLKGTCVELDEVGESSGTSTGDGEDLCPVCEDADGDGFGFGPDCTGPDCDDGNPTRADGCYYVAPDGNDGEDGTDVAAPWATLAHAIGQLRPGDSLVLLPGPGDYTPATTGMLTVACGEGGNAAGDASVGAPISIRGGRDPSEERHAILRAEGAEAVVLDGCSHWKLHGLTAVGGDLEGGATALVRITDAASIEASRLLVSSPNGMTLSSAISISSATDVVVSDSEIYDFHNSGANVRESERVTFRRVYVNSRDREDLADAPEIARTNVTDSGDHGIRVTGGAGHRIENCIVTDTGYALYGDGDVDIDIEGTIALDVIGGIISYGGSLRIRDVVAARSENHGVYLRSPANATLDGITILASGLSGLVGDDGGGTPCADLGGCSFDARNLLSIRNADYGIRGVAPVEWTVASANASENGTDFGADEPIDDAAGIVQGSLSEPTEDVGLGLGQCVAFIPATSAMKGRGIDGADIGANVLHRIVDGERTDEPLWEPTTGEFPCGDIVSGINDVPGASCFDVHERLNVGQNDCALPLSPPACAAE